jgi:hypothetical protein
LEPTNGRPVSPLAVLVTLKFFAIPCGYFPQLVDGDGHPLPRVRVGLAGGKVACTLDTGAS